MKVKLLAGRSGPDGSFVVGDEIDVSKDEAKRMMEANPPQCQPVRSKKTKETTSKR